MERKNALIRDLTKGSVPKTLFTFSLPLFLSGLLLAQNKPCDK